MTLFLLVTYVPRHLILFIFLYTLVLNCYSCFLPLCLGSLPNIFFPPHSALGVLPILINVINMCNFVYTNKINSSPHTIFDQKAYFSVCFVFKKVVICKTNEGLSLSHWLHVEYYMLFKLVVFVGEGSEFPHQTLWKWFLKRVEKKSSYVCTEKIFSYKWDINILIKYKINMRVCK